MSLLRTLKKMILGETWLLPLGVGLTVAAGAVGRELLPGDVWRDLAGFALLAGIAVVLTLSVARSARRR